MTPCVSPVLPSGSADCLTTDGRVVTIRPAGPADALIALHDRSSDQTRYFRYFSVQRHLGENETRRFVTVDHRGREALVVLERGTVVGIGGYDSLADPSVAELSFLVDDAYQRRGIGSLLLEHLSERARARGIHYLDASVLATNHLMLDVFTRAGFQQRHQLEDGVVELLLDLDYLSVARPSIEAREHVADIASMRRILRPDGIVFVIGAPEQDAIGRTLATGGSDLAGPTFAVNPAGVTIGGASGRLALSDIPQDLDLAVITVGPEALASTLERCGDRHVAAALVSTPVSHPAVALELRTVARDAGMRLVGPGSGGIEHRHHGLHALIDTAPGPAGPVGVGCQSSSIAAAATRGLDGCGVGVASVVTLGAKADVSGNDLLQAWSDDPTVRVAVLQLESLGSPFRFARIARTVGRHLPVVLLRTAGLHESLAADDAVLLTQLGIIDVPSIDEAIDVAALLATEPPPPAGRRVGVVSRGRGPGLVARDQLQDLGLQVTHVRAFPPGRALVEDVRTMRDTPGIDALCLVPGEGDEVPRSAGPAGLPVVVCSAGQLPGRTARTLARSTLHAEWARRAGQLVAPLPPPDRRAVRAILSESPCRASGGWIDLGSVTAALRGHRIDATRPHVVRKLEDAGEAASQVGYPLVLDHAIGHGTEPLREVTTPVALVEEWERLLRRHGPAALPIAVLAAGPRPELSIHLTAHPRLGPVMSLLPSDRRSGPVRRLLPLEEHDLESVLDEVIGSAGVRAERVALRELVLRLAGLVADNPELVEVHLDATDTSSAPALVTGAHLAIAPAPGAGDDQVRHLRRDAP